MSHQLTKKELVREIVRSGKDPKYFINNYAKISHPIHGLIPFKTYEFQNSSLEDFNDYRFNVILKARQMGISTIIGAYISWLMLFHRDKNILVMATKYQTASNLVKKVKAIIRHLPEWIQIASITVDNRNSFELSNGSQIKATSTSGDAGRSEALSLLILDEAAFIDKIDTIWTAAQSTLSTGGQCIALSTPNGVGNWFHKVWVDAEDGKSDWNFIKLHWSLHPDREQKWRDEQDKLLGPSMAAQECDCDFITSGQTVIDGVILEEYRNKQIEEPVEKRGMDSNLWIWRQPDYTKNYVVAADVARGDGQDFSAFHVVEIESMEQVAEYKGKIPTKDFGNLCMNTAMEYNNALLVIENSSIGWASIQQVIDREYDNLFYTSKDLQFVDVARQVTNRYRHKDRQMVPGFSMTMKTRPLVIAKLEEYFREKSVIVHSNRLIDELFVFIWHNNKAQAMEGYNDDLPMSLAIGLWVRDTALRLNAEGIALQKTVLNKMLDYEPVYTADDNQNDEWVMETANTKEDLTWLIK